MSESNQHNMTHFKGRDDAFEFLVQQSQNLLLKEKWRKELELADGEGYNRSYSRQNNLPIKLIGILAILIVLMGLYSWFHSKRNSLDSMTNRMIEDSYFAVVNDQNIRGVKGTNLENRIVDLQNEINMSLEQNDFNAAVGLYLTKEKQTQLSIEDKFYYAVALSKIEKGDYYKAIRLLSQVEDNNDKFHNESLWLQGLLYIKVGSPDHSRIVLKRLIRKSDYQDENVKMLLDKIGG